MPREQFNLQEWRDIKTAPKSGPDPTVLKIDILAKIWLQESDKFEYRRFPDCYWQKASSVFNDKDPWTGLKDHWAGVDEGWRVVAWLPVPEIPKEWP